MTRQVIESVCGFCKSAADATRKLAMAKLILVGGGARSGKSAFALAYAKALGQKRTFVATAQAFDEEMSVRIANHRSERAGQFQTVEEPLDLCQALSQAFVAEVVLVDCLTLWLSNLLLRGDDEAQVERHVQALTAALAQRPEATHVLLVTNEVGMGIVPQTPLGRVFRDVTGRAHQRLAAIADEVYFAAMGLMMRLHPSPVAVFRPGEVPKIGA